MHLKGGRSLILVAALLFQVCCAPRIEDQVIEEQVRESITQLTQNLGFGGPVKFTDFFSVDKVSVVDKKVEGKKCVAVCAVTVGVKESYAADSLIGMAFSGLLGNSSGKEGETKIVNMRFVFELYEGGWRLTGVER
jgi:hypothetical protein